MTILRISLLLLLAVLCLAQTGWQTATSIPGVDLDGLKPADRANALAIMRSEGCTCGCSMKIAECRMKDGSCAYSRRLSAFVVQEASAGKSAAVIRTDLKKYASQPPPALEPPVSINIDGDPVRGSAHAKVTIVEFSDFQCPYCAMAVGQVGLILQQYPNDVKVVFKQFPLDIHTEAARAAEASLAAQAQGKFWELHDKMYANYRKLSPALILLWADQLGLDMNRFKADLSSGKLSARVQAEQMQGDLAGVEGTPTFFINGKKLNEAFQVATVAPLIDQELKGASK